MAKSIRLVYDKAASTEEAQFKLRVQGFLPGESVTLEIWEVDERGEYRRHGERKLGSLKGTIQADTDPDQILGGASATGNTDKKPRVVIATEGSTVFGFTPVAPGAADEGDSWEIQLRLAGDASVKSPTWYVSRNDRRLPATQATYSWYDLNDVAFYNDASTDASGSGGYFHDLNRALDEAQHFIFIADWSFHPYMRIRSTGSETIGAKLVAWAKAHPAGYAAIHTWNHTALAAKDSQNDDGEDIFKDELKKSGNLFWRMSNRTGEDGGIGFGWSHHQKFVVLDCPCPGDAKGRRAIKVFLGGLDLTQGRFDWPEHPFLPEDSACDRFREVTNKDREVHDWYSGEFSGAPLDAAKTQVLKDNAKTYPRQPWHDIHAMVFGPTAWDIVREFIGRWNLDPCWWPFTADGDKGDACIKALQDFFTGVLFDKTKFVQQWDAVPYKGSWRAQIYRSITKDHWGTKTPIKTPARHKTHTEFQWTIKSQVKERSIQDAYLRAISRAERFVYIETQFFISGGSHWLHDSRGGVKNGVAQALVDRILARAKAGKAFHVYIVLPMFPEGDPSGFSNQAQRDYQWETLAYMIRTLENKVPWWGNHLTVGFIANWASLNVPLKTDGKRVDRVRHNRRYMIYVHSKMMLVDDRYVLLGSANLNERSQAGGRDSEIGVGIWPNMAGQDAGAREIRSFRRRIWSEHFGTLPAGWETPEVASCAKAVQQIGNDNWTLLNLGKHSSGGKSRKGHFCCWPIDGSQDTLGFRKDDDLILDGETGFFEGDDWNLWPTHYIPTGDLAE